MIEYIRKQAEEVIKEITESGYVQGGHNGPYHDPETPVRNSAHWLISFAFLYRQTGEQKYRENIRILAEYLYGQRVANGMYAYCCRNKQGKDHVNGTIGQAWAIEGLIEAAKVLEDDKYYFLAKKVFRQHEFSYQYGVWNRIDIDGKVLGFDDTYNHQLWLAGAGAQILSYQDDEEIRKQILKFLDLSANTKLFSVSSEGRINHFAYIPDNKKNMAGYYKRFLINQKNLMLGKPNLSYKEEGYHDFNMYGFALLHQVFPEHELFWRKKFKKALSYALNVENLKRLEKCRPQDDVTGLAMKQNQSKYNIYAYGYNSPAYELPFIMKEFDCIDQEMIQKIWDKQLVFIAEENDIDKRTFAARLYESVRAL